MMKFLFVVLVIRSINPNIDDGLSDVGRGRRGKNQMVSGPLVLSKCGKMAIDFCRTGEHLVIRGL